MSEAIKEIKVAMNYTETKNTCSICAHAVEHACSHVDRSWYTKCELNPAVKFNVNPKYGCCDHFKDKD